MEVIVLFDPGIRTFNKGDEIIMASAEYELNKASILNDKFVIRSSTHAPIATWYQNTDMNPRMKVFNNAQYKFICGSNLLWKNMLKVRPSLNVNLLNCKAYKNSILMGVGIGQSNSRTNLYTKILYSKILSKDFMHSTRDERTADFLRDLGYKAVDTGCPTMWNFTEEFCSQIPCDKADKVIFTLTDYGQNKDADQEMINILKENYKNVYFWIQGVSDKEYFDSLENTEDIIVVPPTLDAYSKTLKENDIDYVGTRLHAGLFAMQHKKRTLIIAIDNRVRDMKKSYSLNTVERNSISEIQEKIHSSWKTKIKLKTENITTWLSQFEN